MFLYVKEEDRVEELRKKRASFGYIPNDARRWQYQF